MRVIISYQMKAKNSEIVQKQELRMVHYLEDVKEYVQDKIQLLNTISNYDYCQTFIQGIKNSPIKKSNLSETKKKMKEREYEEDDEEDDDNEDEKFDNMLEDYGHAKFNKGDVKTALDKISKPKPKAVKPKDSTESEASISLETARGKILKEIKSIFANCSSVSFDFDSNARTELLDFALQKLNKYIRQGKTKLWVVHLLFALGHHVSLNEVLRKKKRSMKSSIKVILLNIISLRSYSSKSSIIL